MNTILFKLLQTLSQISVEQNLPVFAMEDESAIFVKENEATYAGQIFWINNGNIGPVSQKILEQTTGGKGRMPERAEDA